MTVARALLVVNRKAGTGGGSDIADALRARLASRLPDCRDIHLAVTRDHADARARVLAFLRADDSPAVVLVGGGSGTLRAVVEACCELGDGEPPPASRIRIAPLRMGSGNMVAKKLGHPPDASQSVDAAARGIASGLTQPATVIRVDVGSTRRCFGLSMAGFGAFGRVAEDVERWPRSWPGTRRALAAVLGVEMWTNVEYGACIAARAVQSLASPATCELVRLTHDGRSRELRLLAGLLFTFRIPQYPFDPGVAFGDGLGTLHVVAVPESGLERLTHALWPPLMARRAESLRISPGNDVVLELLDRRSAAFFVDEDADTFEGSLRISMAGTIALVPAA